MKISFCSKCLLFGVGLLVSTLAFQAAVPDQSDGATIFKTNCMMCHGPDGKGFDAGKTPNFTDPKWQASITDEKMRDTVKNGKKGTAMAGFSDRLKDEEITSVIAFIRSLDSSKKK